MVLSIHTYSNKSTLFVQLLKGTNSFNLLGHLLNNNILDHIMMITRLLRLAILMNMSLWLSTIAQAQHDLVLYQMQDVPQAVGLNPSFQPPVQAYFNIPLLSGVNIGGGNSSYLLKDLGIDAFNPQPDFALNSLLTNSTRENQTNVHAQADLIGFGFAHKRFYFNFGIREYFDAKLYAPTSLIDLANAIDSERYIVGKTYDLKKLGMVASHYRSFSIGASYQASHKLSIGGRVNYLMGLENIWTINEGLKLETHQSGRMFVGTGSFSILSSGLAQLSDNFDLGNYFLNAGNHGVSADLGFDYHYDERFSISASIINIGFIKWKDRLAGVKVGPGNLYPKDKLESILDELTDGTAQDHVQYQTPTPVRAYINGRYTFGNGTALGFLYSGSAWYGTMEHAIAFSLHTRLQDRIGLLVNYSIYNNSYLNIGTGLSLHLGTLQLYALTDNILGFFGQGQNLHANLGLNILLGPNTNTNPVAATQTNKQNPTDVKQNATLTKANADLKVNPNARVTHDED